MIHSVNSCHCHQSITWGGSELSYFCRTIMFLSNLPEKPNLQKASLLSSSTSSETWYHGNPPQLVGL